jgi:chromosome segregation ATPase
MSKFQVTSSNSVMSMEGQMYSLEKRIKDLEGENADLNNERRAITGRLNAAEEALRRDRDDKENEIRRLKGRLEEKEKECDDLTSKNKELRKAITTGDQVTNTDLENLQSKYRAANLKISELENELRIKRGASANLQDRLAEIEELRNTDAALRSQLRNAREEIENLGRDIDKLRIVNSGLEGQLKEISTINSVLRDKNREIDELERKVSELNQYNKELKLKLIETEQNITKTRVNREAVELSKEIETLRIYMKSKDEEIKRLNIEIQDLQDLRKRCDSLEDEIASLKRQLEKTITQRDRLKFENEDIKKTMEEATLLKFKIDELTFKLISLQTEIDVKDKKVAFFEEENNSLQHRVKSLKNMGDGVEDLKSELMTLQEEFTRQRRTIEEKNNQIELVNSQMRQLKDRADLSAAEREKMRKLEREINQKNEEIDSLIQNMKELQLQFEELKREMEDSNQAERLREELNRLTRSYNQLEAQSSAKIRQTDEELNELRKNLANMEESKLLLIRDHRIEIENMMAIQKELEKALKSYDSTSHGPISLGKGELTHFENQMNDLRSRLAKSEMNRASEVGELKQKVIELQRQLADVKLNDMERDRPRIRHDDDSVRLHKVIEEYMVTIETKNVEISALKERLSSGGKFHHGYSGSKKDVMSAEEKEDLMQELCLLREKLAQREECNERNERELRRVRQELLETTSGIKRTTYDRAGTPTSPIKNQIENDEVRKENEHLLSLLNKRDGTERDLRRQIISLQKELEETKRGLSSSKDGSRTMNQMNKEALIEAR